MKQGWEIKKLGDIILENKKSILKSKGNEEGEYPFFISGKKVKTYNKSIIDGYNIYLPTGGNFYVHFYEGKASYSTDTWSIKTKNNTDIKYFYFFLLLNQEYINEKHFKGATIKHLQKNDFREIEIPLPPIEEQQRIVTILDEVFQAVTKAKSYAEQNLKNAKELFESYLQGVFENKGEGWDEKKLIEVCVLIMGQSPSGETYNTDGIGTPLINGPVEFGKEPFSKTIMSKFTTDPTKYCKEGDLILCVRGSTTGRINIAGFDACIGRGVAAIRYSKNQLWLNYFILSSRQKIYNLGTGATFPNVSGEILKNLLIPIPPLKAQQDIVKKFESLSTETKKLEAIYQQKINDLEELKKSVLQKAFSGELKTDKLCV